MNTDTIIYSLSAFILLILVIVIARLVFSVDAHLRNQEQQIHLLQEIKQMLYQRDKSL